MGRRNGRRPTIKKESEMKDRIMKRKKRELISDFVRRVYEKTNPNWNDGSEHFAETIVKEGYESPYAFGKALRTLVKNDNATIYASKIYDGRKEIACTYYAFNGGNGNPTTMAALRKVR